MARDRNAMAEERNMLHIDYLFKVQDEIDYFTEAFTVFLFENQEESMVNTRAYLDLGQLVMTKEAEVVESQKILSIIKSTLYSLGGLLKFRRLCHTILYELAPSVWRKKYMKEKEKLKGEASEAADHILAELALFKMNVPIQQPRLDNLVIFLSDTVRNLGPPANYFTNFLQMDLAIRYMELENLYAFQNLASLVTKQEEHESAKNDLQKSCQCEIQRMESLIDRMSELLYSKVKQMAITDKRSQNVMNKYWRVVTKNDALSEAITLVLEMYGEFIGQDAHPTEEPLEMLDVLTEDIVMTQMELCEIPKKAAEEIRAFICDKDDMKRETMEHDKRKYDATEKLLYQMKRSWALTAGQQGHPLRYRSQPPETMAETKMEKPRTAINQRLITRIKRVFEPADQEDALLDTITKLEEVREDKDWLFGKGSDSEGSSESSSDEA